MATRLTELETESGRLESQDAVGVSAVDIPEQLVIQQDRPAVTCHITVADLESAEYEFLYRPTMVGVYTARHQQMPRSDRALREHVFGSCGRPGCAACREETDFLVAHQRKFF